MPLVPSTGGNLLEPGSLTSVLPLIGWITTLWFGTGVGVGVGVGSWAMLPCGDVTVKERVLTVWLPAPSVARTENTYSPGCRPLKLAGDVHGPNAPTAAPGPSSLHSNVEAVSVELNPNDGAVSVVGPLGPEITSAGGG